MMSAATIAGRVRAGELDPVSVTRGALKRLEERDPNIHAYLDADADAALERAEQVAEDAARGDDPGRLAGVPISLKDNIAVKGRALTAGSRILQDYHAPYHSTVVRRLLAEGAVLLGRTNLDEFAMGSSTENSAYAATTNPWDERRVPGGSSGGSAAAVAAGIVPVALGSDTGGSIRQPAALCGVTGFKPTYGSVSRHGLVAFGSSLEQIGPLAAHAEDAALVYDVIAGHDPLDPTTTPAERPSAYKTSASVEGLRVAVPEELLDETVEPRVLERVAAAIDLLGDAGAITKVVPKGRLAHVRLAVPAYYLISACEASSNLARYDGMRFGPRLEQDDLLGTYQRTRGSLFGTEVKRRILLGTFALSAGHHDAWYRKALEVRRLIADEFRALLQEFDLIAGPTSPSGAFPLGEKEDEPWAMYQCDALTAPACLAGLPSISLPCGLAKKGPYKGFPVGLQLMGRAHEDHRVLAAARAFEALRGEPERCALYGNEVAS